MKGQKGSERQCRAAVLAALDCARLLRTGTMSVGDVLAAMAEWKGCELPPAAAAGGGPALTQAERVHAVVSCACEAERR